MRVRRLKKDPAALEITAFLNLIVVLVPFLLSTAVFTRLSVLDMSLPTMSGADVVRELRAAGHTDLPIVVVSGSERRDTRLTAAELWPGAWLCKPIKPRELVAVVRDLTRRHDGSLPDQE